jgi:hypothetical protein
MSLSLIENLHSIGGKETHNHDRTLIKMNSEWFEMK